jgi:hypothetical protein
MRADALAELRAIMRGERAQSSGTDGTPGTLTIVPAQKCPSFHAFHVFRSEQGILRNEHFEPWPLPHDTCSFHSSSCVCAIDIGSAIILAVRSRKACPIPAGSPSPPSSW